MAPLEIRHRSVRPISAKHAQASRFLQQSRKDGLCEPRYRQRAGCRGNGGDDRVSRSSRDQSQAIETLGAGHRRRFSPAAHKPFARRSEEHTSELQSLMRKSYAVICLKNKKKL